MQGDQNRAVLSCSEESAKVLGRSPSEGVGLARLLLSQTRAASSFWCMPPLARLRHRHFFPKRPPRSRFPGRVANSALGDLERAPPPPGLGSADRSTSQGGQKGIGVD